MSTMREVAALAGVSGKIVSRVINGDRYVSAAVRARVGQAVAELDYLPNTLSQTFRAGRDNAIGVAVPDIADPFFGAVIKAVDQRAPARRTTAIVTSLSDDPADERPAVQALLHRQLAGLIIAPVSTDQSYLAAWQPRTPLVSIDRPANRLTADIVVEDDFGGAQAAGRHLIDRGHRRIAFVGNAAAVVTTDRRLLGYRAVALGEAGIAMAPHLAALYGNGADNTVPLARALLAQPNPPTALFSFNSKSSIAVVPELHGSGHADPSSISFGDFPMAAALRPAVTMLDHNPARVEETAADRLYARIEGSRARLKRNVVLPVPLVVCQSSEISSGSGPPAKSTRPAKSTHPRKKRIP